MAAQGNDPDGPKDAAGAGGGFYISADDAARLGLVGRYFRVDYEVSGFGVDEISYTEGESDAAEVVVVSPSLPWAAAVVLKGADALPMLTVSLAEDGGRADSVIRVEGVEVMRCSAAGAAGISVCTAQAGGVGLGRSPDLS